MSKKTFEYLWRNKWLTSDAKTIADMSKALREAADELDAMAKDGFQLDTTSGVEDDYASLITLDEKVAKKWKAKLIK
jgi:hypothetical protein